MVENPHLVHLVQEHFMALYITWCFVCPVLMLCGLSQGLSFPCRLHLHMFIPLYIEGGEHRNNETSPAAQSRNLSSVNSVQCSVAARKKRIIAFRSLGLPPGPGQWVVCCTSASG